MRKLKVIVFDLDYTLWPFWVDTHVRSPIRKDKNNQVIDGTGQKIKHYPDVPETLNTLHTAGYELGIASRTEWPEGARQLLKLFDWNKYFKYQEIYPGCKTTHFKKIREASGVSYSSMLFFDDEQRNISDINAIGVMCKLVQDGVNKKLVMDCIEEFENAKT